MIHWTVAFCATRFVEPGEHSDAFQQRRFAGTVFTYDDGNGAFEIKPEAVFEQWQAKRIGFRFAHQTLVKYHALEIRSRETDDSLLSAHDSFIPDNLANCGVQTRSFSHNPIQNDCATDQMADQSRGRVVASVHRKSAASHIQVRLTSI